MTITQPEGSHLAHFNWSTLVGDIGSPEVAGFENAVPKVNALAERSPGFVWRSGREMADALAIGWDIFVDKPQTIASFSVWASPAHIADYVYKTVHGAFFRRRVEWFVPGSGGHVLWWVPAGTIPTMEEARARVMQLAADGPGPQVFTFETVGLRGGSSGAGAGETPPTFVTQGAAPAAAIE